MTGQPEDRVVSALSFLIGCARAEAGLPRWNEPGIRVVVTRMLAAGDPPDLVLAAGCAAARDPGSDKPVMIELEHRDRARRRLYPEARPEPVIMCRDCGLSRAGHNENAAWLDDPHPFVPLTARPARPVAGRG